MSGMRLSLWAPLICLAIAGCAAAKFQMPQQADESLPREIGGGGGGGGM